MISKHGLEDLLKKYDVNAQSILDFKRGRILAFGDYEKIDYALNYLIIDLELRPRRIEKCPSVLYFGVNHLKENYDFLCSKGFNVLKLNDCLHVLSCEPEVLKDTYDYVSRWYGDDLVHYMTSVLSVPVSVINRIEEVCGGRLSKKGILSIAGTKTAAAENLKREFVGNVSDISKVIDLCIEYGIPYKDGGSVFDRTSSELKAIILTCEEHGIDYTKGGNIFKRTPFEIKENILICKKYGLDYTDGGMLFRRNGQELEKIIELCEKYNIDYRKNKTILQRK